MKSKKAVKEYYPGLRDMDDITNIVNEYFTDIAVTYFGHVKVWPEGKFTIAAIKHDWPIEFVSQGVPPVGFLNYPQISNRIIFPSMDRGDVLGYSDETIRMAKEKYHILHPMVITRRYEDYYEVFAFDVRCQHAWENPYEIYMNNQQLFENFIHYYKERAQQILREAENKPVFIDEKYLFKSLAQLEMQVQIPSFKMPNIKKYYLRYKKKDIALSSNEYRALSLLAHGKQIKSIARDFGVATRTIETYFERIRSKLDISDREELISLYWSNKIMSVKIPDI